MDEPTTMDNYLDDIESITKTETDYTIKYSSGEIAKLIILNDHVFRFYLSPTGTFLKYPVPKNPDDTAKIVVKDNSDYDQGPFQASFLEEYDSKHVIETKEIEIRFDKLTYTITIFDKRTQKLAFEESSPISYSESQSMQVLIQHTDEYYFGGGMQNGRFTHKGEVINIVNSNQWDNGGVTSPCPFFWSSYGFGVLRNTWKEGSYDFGSKCKDTTKTVHSENYFDAFYFINPRPEDILNDYYELTGNPLLMPLYAFYEAHLNTFNRDYWFKTDCSEYLAILFEDGKCYKKFKPDEKPGEKGILESLNGEKDNYQFSARAMIDRYKKHDMPLGIFVPNDGYGSGYGQTTTFEGDLQNLKQFIEYAHVHGVEVGLWTESQLQPKEPSHPQKGERDLCREIGVGSVALKCDVAWIGQGYSFGLTAVETATKMFEKQAGSSLRPFIIMVDGWAGTQRYSGIWSGDQTGGKWEYIRFHIPTYIGSGLSGIPIVGSDMDGIYGGGVKKIQVRDFQWKAFTPLQLNMDGWGTVPKNPFYYDDEAKNIIRAYLKLKSSFLPYNYTIGYESTQRLPMIRAMFLEFPEETPAYTKDSQYQYMWGPSILVAPVYEEAVNGKGVPIRKNIYLPDPQQVWVDMFTGEKYRGGKIYDNIEVPLWKIPVFIRDGAILPMVHCNNNPNEIKKNLRIFQIYPNSKSNFKVYEDDGRSLEYLSGGSCTTKLSITAPVSNETGDLTMYIQKTSGQYINIVKNRTTILRIMASIDSGVKVAINGEAINIKKVKTKEDFDNNDNVFYYEKEFLMNPYFKDVCNDIKYQRFLLIKLGEIDITKSEIVLKIIGYCNKSEIIGEIKDINESLKAPANFNAVEDKMTHTSIELIWNPVDGANYYEIEKNGFQYSYLQNNRTTFDDLTSDTKYRFRVRAVNDSGVSKWSRTVFFYTKEDPKNFAVVGVSVVCNYPCQPNQAVSNLTKLHSPQIWHTDWNKPGCVDRKTGQFITLKFDLHDVYLIEKIQYIPRADAGNGTLLCIRYRYSADDIEWSPFSEVIRFERNSEPKDLVINDVVLIRYFQIDVLHTVGGFGSGKQIIFYRKPSNRRNNKNKC